MCDPPSVPSILTSLVHYTSMDDFDNLNLNQSTPLENIMVQTVVSRNLSFDPLSKYTIT